MPAYNKTFTLSVEDIDMIETALRERKSRLAGPTADELSPEPDTAPASIALLVGPEGGLGKAEIAAAEQAGFEALALGPRVLRTETAPLAAIAILQSRWGDM